MNKNSTMKRLTLILLSVTLTISIASCGSLHKAVNDTTKAAQTTNENTNSRLDAIAGTFGSWETLQGGGSVSIGGAKSFSSSMQVRMIRNKAIYISLRPVLGIEVGKLIITNDSILVIDKLHHQYISEKVSLITNGIPATVNTVQDIFLGRAFIIGEGTFNKGAEKNVTMRDIDGTYSVEPKKQYSGFSYAFQFDSENRIKALDVTPSGSNSSTYAVNYSDVETTQAGNIAGTVNISTEFKGKPFTFNLQYSSLNWGEQVNIDTRIPSGYRRIPGKELLSITEK